MKVELNPGTFTRQMVGLLENWPLYKRLEFEGKVTIIHHSSSGSKSDRIYLPAEIQLYCVECNNIQRWIGAGVEDGKYPLRVFKGYESISYECKNCSRLDITYFLLLDISSVGGSVVKVGQNPPLEREPSGIVAATMEKDDLTLYKHALTCRNSNFGIGAVAYLRRIVENRINYLLDLIGEAAVNLEPESKLIVKLTEMKSDKRFSAKIEYAAELLPESLKRGGQNPIAVLHDLSSEALHAKSDDECVEVFDRCRLAFEHVIKRLKEDKDEDDAYYDAVKRLSLKAAKKSGGKGGSERSV